MTLLQEAKGVLRVWDDLLYGLTKTALTTAFVLTLFDLITSKALTLVAITTAYIIVCTLALNFVVDCIGGLYLCWNFLFCSVDEEYGYETDDSDRSKRKRRRTVSGSRVHRRRMAKRRNAAISRKGRNRVQNR